MIAPWPSVSEEQVAACRVFKVRRVSRRSPRTGDTHDFFILEAPDWVNVIAVTPDQQLVLVEQFRHGTGTVDLEIPGGVMDPGETSPLATGVRELREETGYVGDQVRLLGQVRPNPALFTNTCYTVLIENCTRQAETQWDHGEDLATRLVPVAEIPRLVADGTIRHSLVVAALYHFALRPEAAG